MTPLLSVCIPTYNRADKLRVMLGALLPQVAELGGIVEVCVSDNGSPDHTPEVVAEAAASVSIRTHRQPENLGVIRNIHHVTVVMPRGEWVWVLGDDDLLRPNALRRVVEAVERNADVDAIYLNFEIGQVETDWPREAKGGYTGTSTRPANEDLTSHRLERWEDVLSARSAVATQVYAHVVRRRIWSGYAEAGRLGEPFESPRWTFPHTFMIARAMFGRPAFYVGQPVLAMFNGAQSWTAEIPFVWTEAFPGLIRYFAALGLAKHRVRMLEQWADEGAVWALLESLDGRCMDPRVSITRFLGQAPLRTRAWGVVVKACYHYGYARVYGLFERRLPWVLPILNSLRSRAGRVCRWFRCPRPIADGRC